MDTRVYNLQIRVLIYRDEGNYVAHALEMDLVAYGKTEKAALSELQRLIACQVSFAIAKGEEHLILFPAERALFDRWEAAQNSSLRALATDKPASMKARAVVISFSKEQIRKLIRGRSRFAPMTEAVCA